MKKKSKIVPATDGSPIKVLKPELRFDFGPKDPPSAVRKLIEGRVGAANAITIEGIAQELWPHEWFLVSAESKGFPVYPWRVKIQRDVKQIVRDLRRQGVGIGSSRGTHENPPGYYLISNSEELEHTLAPIFCQALDELRTIHAMTGIDLFIPELAQKRGHLAGQKQVSAESGQPADREVR